MKRQLIVLLLTLTACVDVDEIATSEIKISIRTVFRAITRFTNSNLYYMTENVMSDIPGLQNQIP